MSAEIIAYNLFVCMFVAKFFIIHDNGKRASRQLPVYFDNDLTFRKNIDEFLKIGFTPIRAGLIGINLNHNLF